MTPIARRATGTFAFLAFAASVVLANWLTTTFGFIPVGFGLTATAGTLVAGAALALRDLIQDTLGRVVSLLAILVGSAASFAVADPFIALASVTAFAVSELADFGVYTPIRSRARFGGRRWAVAVIASGAVGAIVDTVVFLGIAFGPASIAPALAGQLVGKAWAALLYLAIGWVVARAVLREPQHAKGA